MGMGKRLLAAVIEGLTPKTNRRCRVKPVLTGRLRWRASLRAGSNWRSIGN
jgi:hypothetical protein